MQTVEAPQFIGRLGLGCEIASWADPFEALAAVAAGEPESVRFEGDCPEGMDFVDGWVGVLGYDLALHKSPLLRRAYLRSFAAFWHPAIAGVWPQTAMALL